MLKTWPNYVKTPIPAKYVTVGITVTSSSKVSKSEAFISDLSKLLNSVSIFLSTSVIKSIKRIRNEIFILLIGLNQLYENIKSCEFLQNDILVNELQNTIQNLNNNILILEELFPSIKPENDTNTNSIYQGFKIIILKEETTDNNTNLFRKRVIVTNSQDIIEYEGTPTYSNKDQILIKEGQFYIDSKFEQNTTDNGTNNISDDEASILMRQIGMDSDSIQEASNKENEINEILHNQIQNNPEDKNIYNSLMGDNLLINPKRVEQIKRIINSLIKSNTNANLIQNRLTRMSQSLLQKGYKLEEIQEAFRYQYSEKYNIKIIDGNITISKK